MTALQGESQIETYLVGLGRRSGSMSYLFTIARLDEVSAAAFLATGLICFLQTNTAHAYPTCSFGGNSNYHSVVRNIVSDDSAGPNKTISAQRHTTYDRRIGSNRSTLFNERLFVLVLPFYVAARVDYVREHHGWSAEH